MLCPRCEIIKHQFALIQNPHSYGSWRSTSTPASSGKARQIVSSNKQGELFHHLPDSKEGATGHHGPFTCAFQQRFNPTQRLRSGSWFAFHGLDSLFIIPFKKSRAVPFLLFIQTKFLLVSNSDLLLQPKASCVVVKHCRRKFICAGIIF